MKTYTMPKYINLFDVMGWLNVINKVCHDNKIVVENIDTDRHTITINVEAFKLITANEAMVLTGSSRSGYEYLKEVVA